MSFTSIAGESVCLPAIELAGAFIGVPSDFAMTAKKALRFPRSGRLLRHADFQRVYQQGRRHFSPLLTVFYMARPKAEHEDSRAGVPVPRGVPASRVLAPHVPVGLRVGFGVGRALGGAVDRNRMKRRLREAVRLSNLPRELAADVVINPKKNLLTAEFDEILREVSRAFIVVAQKLETRA